MPNTVPAPGALRRVTGRVALALAPLVALAVMAGLTVAAAQNADMRWQFNAYNDPDNKGRMTARLVYGVPETDNVQVVAVCNAAPGTSARFSAITFGVDTGGFKNGSEVKLRFSGGGFDHQLRGMVSGVGNTEEGLAGVTVTVPHDDAIWTGLLAKRQIDYLVPGYRAATLELGRGRGEIRAFLEACKSYAAAAERQTAQAAQAAQTGSGSQSGAGTGAGDGITQKEAFENAKELDTIEAWEAFLNAFPSGFRADLARAYVKRLAGRSPAPPREAEPPRTPRRPPPAPAAVEVAIGPGAAAWRNRRQRVALNGKRRAYTASVTADGMEFVAYCHSSRTLGPSLVTVLREARKGARPRLIEALRDGLAAAPSAPGGMKRIEWTFSSGHRSATASAEPRLLRRELWITSDRRNFSPADPTIEAIMSSNTMTLGIGTFSATFQLRGSRAKMCAVARGCGANVPGCVQRVREPRLPPARPVPPVRETSRCSGGRYFSRARRTCICPRSRPVWDGRRCLKNDPCPGDSVMTASGQCFKENEPPPRRPARPRPNPTNQQIIQNCNLLNIACASGIKAACKKMQTYCDRG